MTEHIWATCMRICGKVALFWPVCSHIERRNEDSACRGFFVLCCPATDLAALILRFRISRELTGEIAYQLKVLHNIACDK